VKRSEVPILISETMKVVTELNHLKGGEYAGDDDALANFRRNALALGITMETCWAVYAGKHWDALQQWIKDLNTGKKRERMEGIEGRIDDLITYLILFKGIHRERMDAGNLDKPRHPKKEVTTDGSITYYKPCDCGLQPNRSNSHCDDRCKLVKSVGEVTS
jgi:hypothetical protein